MKILKKNIKEKVFEVGAKVLLLAATGLFCLWMISGARAEMHQITDVKAQESDAGDQRVVVKFSAPLNKDQVSLDFQRNFIQVSLHDVSVFPAKNQNVKSPILDKIFAYQYQPDLARARILLKSDSQAFKNRTSWKVEGDSLIVEIASTGGDLVTTRAAAPQKRTSKISSKTSFKSSASNAGDDDKEVLTATNTASDAAEDKIVQEILADTKKSPSSASNSLKASGDEPLFLAKEPSNKISAEKAEKSSSSPVKKMASGLLTVIALMGAVAFGFRKFVQGRGLSLVGRQNRIIDVVSTHLLGAKKSISVIKVGDQYMVISIAGDNINLLSVLGPEARIERYLDDNQIGGNFDSALKNKMAETALDEFHAPAAASNAGIRESIKRRLTGFKPL